jgi:ribosomal protein S18 acetylase RimI-like enzyme
MTSTDAPHPLDNVFWRALATSQARLALGDGLARRFRPEYAVFSGMPAPSAAGFEALAALMGPGEVTALSDPRDVDPGTAFEVLDRKDLVQMVGPATGAVASPQRLRRLGPDDLPGMTALVRATEPGPWFARTAELGAFHGVEADGRIVAMAGERLRVPGHAEISAVCCDPDWRGRGLAADLMRRVSQGIVARGEQPFLHVLAENATAIALYEKLGFRRRLQTRLTILRRHDAG